MKNHNRSLCHSECSEESASALSLREPAQAGRGNLSSLYVSSLTGSPLGETGSRIHVSGCHFEHREKSHTRGFALLLTLVVVSVIGVVAFGVGRLTLTEFRQTMRFQDSQNALQAAEAGIEDGLVRFRFNRDTEVPYGSKDTCTSTVPEPTATTTYVLRVNLSNGVRSCIDPSKTPPPDPSQNVYDLRVYFKAKSLGTALDCTAPNSQCTQSLNDMNSVKVSKDNKLTISNANTPLPSTIQIRSIATGTTPENPNYMIIEYVASDGTRTPYLIGSGVGPGAYQLNQMKYGLTGWPFPIPSGTTSIDLKPLEDVRLSAGFQNANVQTIDFGVTLIQSIGYSNGVKRSLTSVLNRSSGSTQGIYNYVLFNGSASDLSSPQP